MKTKLFGLLLTAIILGFVGCAVDDNSPVSPTESDYPYPVPDYESVKCNLPVFVSDNLVPVVRKAVESYLTNITTMENADVAVVKPEDIPAYEDKLVDLYNRGGLIVLARPTGEHYAEFAAKYDLGFDLPENPSQPILLFAFDNKQNCYVLFANGPFNGEYNDDNVTEIVPDHPVEEVVKEPELEDEQTYNKRRIFEFFRWVKTDRAKQSATRGTTWISVYDPYVYFKECQHITHNYELSLNHTVCHVWLCSKDVINVNSSIEVGYDIYAAYVYEGSPNDGDYYIVTRSVTAHNGNCYAPFSKIHGLVTVDAAGYYMKSLEVISKLKDVKGQNDLNGLLFCGDVTPTTTVESTSYSTGISLGLNGALSVGTTTAASCGFSAGYESSSTRTISDLEITKAADTDSRMVKHTYTVKNIKLAGKYNFEYMGSGGTNLMTNHIPLIARADFDNYAEWCWRVPAGTNGVGNNKDTQFSMYTHLDYNYGCYVVSNFQALYGDNKSYDYSVSCSQSVRPPMRIPFGVLSFTNAHDDPIARITIWDISNGGEGAHFTTIPSSYEKDEVAKCVLPVGKYYLEYDRVDGSTNVVKDRWKVAEFEIKNNKSEYESTTIVSTTDATIIK